MKKSLLLLTLCIIFLYSCQDPLCGCAPPVMTRLQGNWEWVKTQTPSGMITTGQTGTSKDLYFSHDSIGFYANYYEGDSLLSKLIFSQNGHQENEKQNSVIVRFNPKGYIKFTLNGNSMETSAFMPEYSVQADTIRHFYEYKGENRN